MTGYLSRADALEAGGNSASSDFGNAQAGQTVVPCEPDAEVALDARHDDVELEVTIDLEELPELEISTAIEDVILDLETSVE